MAPDKVDYRRVIEKLKIQRDALTNAIDALNIFIKAGSLPDLPEPSEMPAKPIDPASIPDDAFFGLSIAEATKKYLSLVKKKQTIKEIAEALDRGGLPHTSSNFLNTVGTMLNRSAVYDSELVRVGRGAWGLASWYGNRRPKPEPPRRSKSAKRPVAKAVAESSESGPTLKQLAKRVLHEAGEPLHVDEIIKRIEGKTGRSVKKDTLAALFSIATRKGDTFIKKAPGVFGLIG